MLDEQSYRAFFERLTGRAPYAYQVDVAQSIAAGENVILRAPTGAGKTWATLAPYLFLRGQGGPARIIYALPLRTLAQGIYREARERLPEVGLSPDLVTMQTGEQPDDEFLQRGSIIVTTYDQVLSGLLHGPYGLSDRLHNINAAAVVGNLIVFDEFHLMEPSRAFLTAVAGLQMYRQLCQSVWMTATATTALEDQIRSALAARSVPADAAAQAALHAALPSVTTVRRCWRLAEQPISADAVLDAHRRRSVVIVNQVSRAQAIFEDLAARKRVALKSLADSSDSEQSRLDTMERKLVDTELLMLHARFFRSDRAAKEARLREWLGPGASRSVILIATQVVEAGIDISSDDLHTELCPMSALVQRAGRCARYPNEDGTVHIYPLPEEERTWLPYGNLHLPDPTLALTEATLRAAGEPLMDPATVAGWVQAVHQQQDEATVRGAREWRGHQERVLGVVAANVAKPGSTGVADLIREETVGQIRVLIATPDTLPEKPGERETVTVMRWNVQKALLPLLAQGGAPVAWVFDWNREEPGWRPVVAEGDLTGAFIVALSPEVARYSRDTGLHLGERGAEVSPDQLVPKRPGYGSYLREPWTEHARLVATHAERRLVEFDGLHTGILGRGFNGRYGLPPDALLAAARVTGLLHDLGKLRTGWQRWAEAVQRDRDPAYVHVVPLAHTDLDPKNWVDRERERRFHSQRPAHAAAGALYAAVLLTEVLAALPEEAMPEAACAVMAAILAHHGSWIPAPAAGLDLELGDGLAADWDAAVSDVLGGPPNRDGMQALVTLTNKRDLLEGYIAAVATSGTMSQWWPLVAYLTRTLRLSDQKATAEGAGHGD